MTDSYKLLPSDGYETLAKLCDGVNVNLTDVWIPLHLLLHTRGREDTPVPISPSTPIVLLNRSTGGLVTRRTDILALIPLLFVNEQNLSIPPNAVPDDYTLFARASKNMSKKRMKKGTFVLHRPITSEQAVAEGSALVTEDSCAVKKNTQASKKSTVDLNMTTGLLDTANERRKKRAKVDGVFEEYLQSAIDTLSSGRSTHSGAIIKETMANLFRVRDEIPLHFVMHGKIQKVIQVKGLDWNLPDGRVMYRIFRRGGTVEGNAKFTYADAARLIAVFMIDNVLLKRAPVQTDGELTSPSWSLIDPDLPIVAHKLEEKGYRIVLLDHYPSLHHGNLVTLETKLHPIAELCQQYFRCDVTVLLSTMSYISASYRRDGMPFVLPYSGVWQFFITQLNGGLRSDADSLLVGKCAADVNDVITVASSQGQRDAQFAMNCDLRYIDIETLKKKILHS